MSHQRKLLVSVFILLVRVVVNVYTYTTLPIYYFSQKPWLRQKKAKRMRAVRENLTDPDSAWVTTEDRLTHPVMLPTVTEILDILPHHGHHTPILAYREVLSAYEALGNDGKVKRIDGRSIPSNRWHWNQN